MSHHQKCGRTQVPGKLTPDGPALVASAPIPARHPLQVLDVELTPPAGRERLVAVWSRAPLPLRPEDLSSLIGRGNHPVSRPDVATRDMRRVQESVRQISPDDWHAVALELDHVDQERDLGTK